MAITDATRDDARHLAARYPVARSALLPLLHLVHSADGYVSEEGVALCAEVLGLTKAEVGAVATFYTMYKREPFGDYLLSVCTNPTCQIAGGQAIYDSYVEACGGHVDDSGAGVMVEHAECLGICDAAPVVQINYEMYGPVTHDQAMELLSAAKAGDPPASNRSGEVPPTIHQVHRELSGIEDRFGDHLVEAARLQTQATVPPAYRSGETDIPVTHPGGDPSGHGGASFRASSGIGVTGTRPEEQLPDDQGPVTAEETRRTTGGIAQELAEQVTSPAPPGEPPSVTDQPPLDPDEGATAEEAGNRPAAGSEHVADAPDEDAGTTGGDAQDRSTADGDDGDDTTSEGA